VTSSRSTARCKFVQITAVQATHFEVLFALDERGRIWRLTNFDGWTACPGPTEDKWAASLED